MKCLEHLVNLPEKKLNDSSGVFGIDDIIE